MQDYNQRGVSWIYGYCSTIEPLQNETVFSFFDSMQYTKVSAVDILCYIGALLRKFPHNLEQMATLNYREHKYNRLLDPPFLLFKRQKKSIFNAQHKIQFRFHNMWHYIMIQRQMWNIVVSFLFARRPDICYGIDRWWLSVSMIGLNMPEWSTKHTHPVEAILIDECSFHAYFASEHHFQKYALIVWKTWDMKQILPRKKHCSLKKNGTNSVKEGDGDEVSCSKSCLGIALVSKMQLDLGKNYFVKVGTNGPCIIFFSQKHASVVRKKWDM